MGRGSSIQFLTLLAVLIAWPAPPDTRAVVLPVCETCDTTQTVASRFAPPDGFRRVDAASESFAWYLRRLPILPEGSASLNWRGQLAMTSDEVAGVLDWRLLGSVEQCADIALRLISEYERMQGRETELVFRSLSGQELAWARWLNGRYSLNGDRTSIHYANGASRQATREEFDRYLTFVMSYVNTASMLRDWPTIADSQIAIGDVLIQPFCTGQGSGHLSIVLDACADREGNRLFLFGDGYTPARIPVIRERSPGDHQSAWMTIAEYLHCMRQFGDGTFHRYTGHVHR